MARGTGIRFKAGTTCRFDGGTAPYNPDPAKQVFGPDGDQQPNRDSQAWADMFCGGNRDFSFRRPELGAEWFMWLGVALKMAKAGTIPLPEGAYIEEGNFDGESTLWERTVLEYTGDEKWFGQVVRDVVPVERGDGKSPQTAMATNRPAQKFKYFIELHPKFHYTLYFKNTAPGATGVDPRWPKDQVPADAGQDDPRPTTPTNEVSASAKLSELQREAENLRAKLPRGGGAPMRMLVGEVTKLLDRIKGA